MKSILARQSLLRFAGQTFEFGEDFAAVLIDARHGERAGLELLVDLEANPPRRDLAAARQARGFDHVPSDDLFVGSHVAHAAYVGDRNSRSGENFFPLLRRARPQVILYERTQRVAVRNSQ